MSIETERTLELVKEFGKDGEDSGNTETQIAIFSERIKNLTEHLKLNKKDKSAKRGLTLMVSRRSRLLKYLHKSDLSEYKTIINKLGIRK